RLVVARPQLELRREDRQVGVAPALELRPVLLGVRQLDEVADRVRHDVVVGLEKALVLGEIAGQRARDVPGDGRLLGDDERFRHAKHHTARADGGRSSDEDGSKLRLLRHIAILGGRGEPGLRGDRSPQLAGAARALPAGREGSREPSGGRARARCQPHLELRPLAARNAALAPAPALLHGQVRAVPPGLRAHSARLRSVSRAPRRARRAGDRDRRPPGAGGKGDRHVPGGDTAPEGVAQEVRCQAAGGIGPDRPRRRGAARPGRDQGHGRARAAREAQGLLRQAARPRRPGRAAAPGRRRRGDAEADAGDRQALRRAVRPLLAVDGDSLAHRAYHALPKTIQRAEGRPAGAIVGFANSLLRLWESERPRAIVVGWDTLEAPTYRHTAFAPYQSGREFDADLLEQLPLLPELVEACGFAAAKAPGYEADDFLAAASASEEARSGTVLVVTSDRDAFQLASEHTTILQPVRGVSELARIGPAQVRERYDVDPSQVPDFIALRGDPSDKLPGARGVGPKTAADVLRQYGSLEAALDAGRFSNQAEELRLYRRIATL